jgi:hypothetical protein
MRPGVSSMFSCAEMSVTFTERVSISTLGIGRLFEPGLRSQELLHILV